MFVKKKFGQYLCQYLSLGKVLLTEHLFNHMKNKPADIPHGVIIDEYIIIAKLLSGHLCPAYFGFNDKVPHMTLQFINLTVNV